jgi:hypothetical protein
MSNTGRSFTAINELRINSGIYKVIGDRCAKYIVTNFSNEMNFRATASCHNRLIGTFSTKSSCKKLAR